MKKDIFKAEYGVDVNVAKASLVQIGEERNSPAVVLRKDKTRIP